MNCFNYKGYQGSIETSIKDRCLFGKILNINDLILYEGQTLDELEADLRNPLTITCKPVAKPE